MKMELIPQALEDVDFMLWGAGLGDAVAQYGQAMVRRFYPYRGRGMGLP
jgi:hypothetical protein